MANKADYVELGLACADACRVLDQGVNGRPLGELSALALDTIEELTK